MKVTDLRFTLLTEAISPGLEALDGLEVEAVERFLSGRAACQDQDEDEKRRKEAAELTKEVTEQGLKKAAGNVPGGVKGKKILGKAVETLGSVERMLKISKFDETKAIRIMDEFLGILEVAAEKGTAVDAIDDIFPRLFRWWRSLKAAGIAEVPDQIERLEATLILELAKQLEGFLDEQVDTPEKRKKFRKSVEELRDRFNRFLQKVEEGQ